MRLHVTSLEGQSAPLVLSRRVTQAQLHALLARLHKVTPWLFRLWWLKPDALVPTLLAAEARTLRAAGLQSGAQIEMRLAAPVRGGMGCCASKPAAVDAKDVLLDVPESSTQANTAVNNAADEEAVERPLRPSWRHKSRLTLARFRRLGSKLRRAQPRPLQR